MREPGLGRRRSLQPADNSSVGLWDQAARPGLPTLENPMHHMTHPIGDNTILNEERQHDQRNAGHLGHLRSGPLTPQARRFCWTARPSRSRSPMPSPQRPHQPSSKRPPRAKVSHRPPVGRTGGSRCRCRRTAWARSLRSCGDHPDVATSRGTRGHVDSSSIEQGIEEGWSAPLAERVSNRLSAIGAATPS